MSDPIVGGCLCGAVRYTITADPMFGGKCYCNDCRKASSTGHAAVMAIPEDGFSVTGALTGYESPGGSGQPITRHFCTTCGSAIYSTPTAILRLNYAVEPRYGVVRDVADKVFGGEPIDLSMGYANVIWQRDASSVALRSFSRCASPPFVLNLTGAETISIRQVAAAFGLAMPMMSPASNERT